MGGLALSPHQVKPMQAPQHRKELRSVLDLLAQLAGPGIHLLHLGGNITPGGNERLAQDANGDFLYTFTHPWSDGTTGIRLSAGELLEKLAALVPLPLVHLIRYGGCLAPHSHLRGAIIPTPLQQGVDEEATDTRSPRWSWARLLKRVFALDMAHCPW